MPLGIFFVYGGVIFSMLTAVIYSIKGGVAIKQALAHPEDEDIDFLNLKSKTDSLGYDYVRFIICGTSAIS